MIVADNSVAPAAASIFKNRAKGPVRRLMISGGNPGSFTSIQVTPSVFILALCFRRIQHKHGIVAIINSGAIQIGHLKGLTAASMAEFSSMALAQLN